MSGCSELSTSWIRTSAVMLLLASLMPSAAVCECASMMPGVTCMPRASITSAPSGAVSPRPMRAILPPRTSMSASSSVPASSCVQSVAWRTRITAGAGAVSQVSSSGVSSVACCPPGCASASGAASSRADARGRSLVTAVRFIGNLPAGR